MSPGADVSVVIPVFNGEAYLAEAIDSALGQTVKPKEILVFDNGSTDSSVQIARSKLPPESVVRFEENAGATENFNRSARAATGAFILWLAADDRLRSDHLEICLKALAEQPSAPACLPGIKFIDPAGQTLRTQRDIALASSSPAMRLRAFLRRNRWTEFYCLYRADALTSSPMMTQDFGADVLLTWWFLLRGPLATVSMPLLEYREYPAKTVQDMAHSLDPGAPELHWRKLRLWGQLWSMCESADVDARTGRIARRELITCLAHKSWLLHLEEDIALRWPVRMHQMHRGLGELRRLWRDRRAHDAQ